MERHSKPAAVLMAVILGIACITTAAGAELEGKLLGALTLIVHLDDVKSGTLDVPEQNAYGIPLTYELANGVLNIDFKAMNASFSGVWDNDAYIGTYTQAGKDFSISFTPRTTETAQDAPPQEESPPYIVQDVTFRNAKEGFTISGTITRPDDRSPHQAVVLITGSGSQDRDETIYGLKPFKRIADALAKAGLVVLRYDDRGFGSSEGDASNATTRDLCRDTLGAVEYLRRQSYVSGVGLAGHSEGGTIAAMIAAEDDDISFIICLAGPAATGLQIVLDQNETALKARKAGPLVIASAQRTNKQIFSAVMDESRSEEDRKSEVRRFLDKTGMPREAIEAQMQALFSPWYREFLKTDSGAFLSKAKCPALCLYGSLDTQVSCALNAPLARQAIKTAGNGKSAVICIDGVNHLFQSATTGMATEYATAGEPMRDDVLKLIEDWISNLDK